MKIRWDVRALSDLRDIRRYIAQHASPAAADRVRVHLRARVELLYQATDRRYYQQP